MKGVETLDGLSCCLVSFIPSLMQERLQYRISARYEESESKKVDEPHGSST
jgi:hypothetical protein